MDRAVPLNWAEKSWIEKWAKSFGPNRPGTVETPQNQHKLPLNHPNPPTYHPKPPQTTYLPPNTEQ